MPEIEACDGSRSDSATCSNEPSLHRVLSSVLPRDQIVGVRNISRALTGADGQAAVRAMYHLLEHTNTYPAYKVGSQWAVSLASVQAKRWSQERHAFIENDQKILGLVHLLLSNALPLYANAANGKCDLHQQAQLALISLKAVALIQRLFCEQNSS
jgi:hypothetical protein